MLVLVCFAHTGQNSQAHHNSQGFLDSASQLFYNVASTCKHFGIQTVAAYENQPINILGDRTCNDESDLLGSPDSANGC